MKAALETDFAVPVAWSEDASRTTWENAVFTARLLRPAGIETVVLVSQAWHLPRAIWAFERVGVAALPWPAPRTVLAAPAGRRFPAEHRRAARHDLCAARDDRRGLLPSAPLTGEKADARGPPVLVLSSCRNNDRRRRHAMRRQDQIAEARKLLAHLDNRTTALADGIYRNPVTDYTCPRAGRARARSCSSQDGPLNIGLRRMLPRAGDWMTHDYAGVPILLVRRADGSLGGFSQCLPPSRRAYRRGLRPRRASFRCPYHGWTYGLDGALIARPDEASFAAADRATHGLRAAAGRREIRHDLGRPRPGCDDRCRPAAARHGRRSGGLQPRHLSPLRNPRAAPRR